MKGVLLSSLFFGIWHLPIAIRDTGLDPLRTPLYLMNMALLGALFGLLFLESRSLIPVAAFHGLWNSLEYNLFGFMDQRPLLSGTTRLVFDPEEGCIGTAALVLALAFILAVRSRSRSNAWQNRP